MSDLAYTNSMMNEIRELLKTARQRVAVQVNTELLSTYWNIGRIIVEHEQQSKDRAEYGKQLLKELSKALTNEFGKGFSVPIFNLCGGFIKPIKFNRRCLLNYRGRITASFCRSPTRTNAASMKKKRSTPGGRCGS